MHYIIKLHKIIIGNSYMRIQIKIKDKYDQNKITWFNGQGHVSPSFFFF